VRYTHFSIRNFKGIERVDLDLSKAPKLRVHTLIGLNESGKTTVLEAIDRWSYRESLDALNPPGYGQSDVHELIPIAKRANFNDSIVIEAGVALHAEDQKRLRVVAKTEHKLTISDDIQPFEIKQQFKFTASRVDENQPKPIWTLVARGLAAGERRAHQLTGDAWQNTVNAIKSMLPRIVYFPNFLFEFPDRIYLENPPSEVPKHEFYRGVLQDVLDAIGDGTTLDAHILARAKSSDEPNERALESVLLRMGAHITKTVFTSWDRIFKRPAGNKEIVVGIDQDSRGAWYLKLRLKESQEYYEISERSLGFRWFFSYLLLTQYRGFRTHGHGEVLFLLDEPASNLHPSAQTQLLGSFETLPERCSVIYTTHSHHMIRPEWLDGAFVVRNEGLHYSEDDNQYTARRTIVTLSRYREFAVKHPTQTTYFQPVLDVLDYRPTLLENVPDVVMLEGKTDFYALKWAAQNLVGFPDLRLLPGTGAGSLDAVLRLYLAWGRNFIVLLDSDKAGTSEKERYFDRFGPILNRRIFTLSDIEPTWQGMEMEDLFAEDDRLTIQRSAYPEAEGFNKTHFSRALQELVATRRDVPVATLTSDILRRLGQGLELRVKDAAT